MSVDFEFKDKYDVNDLLKIITALRSPGGCPWDRAQTHTSIKKNFIEETYEVIEAINKNSIDGLREELGDVLLQIVLHTEMEREKGNFDFNDVCNDLCQKLVVRHPHVFGEVSAADEAQALASWDNAKAKTKGVKKQSETMDSVPKELPALMRAQKVQSRAAKSGFDWRESSGAFDKLREEISELQEAIVQGEKPHIAEEFGDLLFSCVNVSRFIDVDSEECLTAATDKFISRFKLVERLAEEKGISMKDSTIEELDLLWDRAKEIMAENSQNGGILNE